MDDLSQVEVEVEDLDDDFLQGESDQDDELSIDGKEPNASDFYTTRKKSSTYPEWPMINIREVHENDVLFGRGGGYVIVLLLRVNCLFYCVAIRFIHFLQFGPTGPIIIRGTNASEKW